MIFFRACSPKRPRTPTLAEMTVREEARAKQAYDQLIEMGGRPSRSVRLQPTWNATYRDGLIYITDKRGELEGTLSTGIDPMNHHWAEESAHFSKELENWQAFTEHQQKSQFLGRPKTRLQLDNTDARLIKDLTRLSDWQEFEVFQSYNVGDTISFEERCRLRLLCVIQWELTPGYEGAEKETKSGAHAAIRDCLSQMERCQENLDAAKIQLDWIKGEWPKVVAQVVDSISKTPALQSILEERLRHQTDAVFCAILDLGGRPSHSITQPDQHLGNLQRLLYWSSETSMYMTELSDWRKFLNWRRNNLDDTPIIQGEKFQCPRFESALDFYADFEKFRKSEHDVAVTWLKCWQRVVRWYEEETQAPNAPGWLDDDAKKAQARLRDSEQKLADAATLLQKSMQERALALAEDNQVIGGEKEKAMPKNLSLPTPPPSSSESSRSSRSYPSSSSSSSMSTQSPESSESSQPSNFAGRLAQNQPSWSKSSTAGKDYRRLKKQNARKYGKRMENINLDQQPLPSFPVPPPRIEIDDDSEMVDAQEDQNPVEGAEEYTTPASEDIVMANFEDSSSNTVSHPSRYHSEPITITSNRTTRKIDSSRKIDQKVPGKVLKNAGKNPTNKAKTFTEEQTMALLNAASTKDSPKEFPQPRRSERIRQKAAAPAVISPSPIPLSQHNATHTYPPLRRSERLQGKAAASTIIPSSSTPSSQENADHISPSSEQKQPLQTLDLVEPLRLSRRKKSKIELNTLEPPRTTMHKNSKIPKSAVEPSRPSRQKALAKQTCDTPRGDY